MLVAPYCLVSYGITQSYTRITLSTKNLSLHKLASIPSQRFSVAELDTCLAFHMNFWQQFGWISSQLSEWILCCSLVDYLASDTRLGCLARSSAQAKFGQTHLASNQMSGNSDVQLDLFLHSSLDQDRYNVAGYSA